MDEKEAKKVWDEYFAKITKRRLAEAEVLWTQIEAAGITNETLLILDFLHFTKFENNAHALEKELSKTYNVKVYVSESDNSYFDIVGTTRPYGVKITKDEYMQWVQFMIDVGGPYACVFSSWAIEAPELEKQFKSEDIQVED